ncbi:YgiT-type zinc finger protein [Caldicellulosiruptoraceae bacterium PP1]
MKCVLCKASLKQGEVNHIIDINNKIIIIKNVPALVCQQCGEYFIDNETAIKLEKIVDELLKNKTEIVIANYSEIAA